MSAGECRIGAEAFGSTMDDVRKALQEAGLSTVQGSRSIHYTDRLLFSHTDRVCRAIEDPRAFVGERLSGDGWQEHLDWWRARAALEAVFQLVSESPSFASALEARRGETPQSGSVHESGGAGTAIAQPEDSDHD